MRSHGEFRCAHCANAQRSGIDRGQKAPPLEKKLFYTHSITAPRHAPTKNRPQTKRLFEAFPEFVEPRIVSAIYVTRVRRTTRNLPEHLKLTNRYLANKCVVNKSSANKFSAHKEKEA
jgi:hypothetical protein